MSLLLVGQPVRLPTPTHTQIPLGTHGGTPSHVGYPRHPPPTVGGTAHPPIPGYSQGHLPPAHQVYSRGAMGQRMPHSNHMQQRQLVHPQVNVPYQRPAFSQQVVRQHHPGGRAGTILGNNATYYNMNNVTCHFSYIPRLLDLHYMLHIAILKCVYVYYQCFLQFQQECQFLIKILEARCTHP